MKRNPKISAAVAAILGVPSTAIVFAAPADTETAASSGELQEITVTAQRRSENLQDVPITIQAMTGQQLAELNVVSFNDLLKYTPNVTYSGNGPGTGNIFMRGLGGVGSGNQSQSTTAPFPNVAVYLDDQSMQFPARNNDVYLVDMERVEVLEGPQGTLFGGGAQAGAIRYITNKPNLSATSGEANAGYGITAGGDPNTNLNATLNLPLTDKLAVRGVIFTDRRGGYIDNVSATIGYHPGTVPYDIGGNPTANNNQVVGANTNSLTYTGARLSALYKVNDDWDVLVQQNWQNMEADGYFYAYPKGVNGEPLSDYQIEAFTPAYSKDRYESTAWTTNGKITDLVSMVYTGSYMIRHIEGQQDYSNYMRSGAGSLYACIGEGAGYFNAGNFPNQLTGHPLQCYPSVGQWHDSVRNVHQSHELRFTTNADYRLRGLLGGYWEKFTIYDNMNFNYLGIPQCNTQAQADAGAAGTGPDCLSAVGPYPGAFATDPSLRTNGNTAFGEDDQRGYKQTAVFTSVDYDIIPKTLTATGGFRWYKYDEFEQGSEYYSESTSGSFSPSGQGLVVNHLNGVCTNAGLCGFPINLNKSETGHRWRGNLTWHITGDMLAYYTYSQGFRPGGFNRTATTLDGSQVFLKHEAPFTAGGKDYQYNKPVGYESDQLINNEVGFKSEWLDHKLLVNISGYVMNWSNVQMSLFDPVHLGNTTFNVNGPTYKVKGFEVQFVAKLFEGFTLEGTSSVNSSDQTSAPCLISAGITPSTPTNPTPQGQCITQVNSQPYTNPFGNSGDRAPFSPPWMFSVRARYDWTQGAYKPFAWVGASHIGPMSNEPANYPSGTDPAQSVPTTTLLRYEIPGYTIYDAAIGVSKDNWTAQINGTNITNEYGPTNASSGQFIESVIPLRPRVINFLISMKF